MLFEDLIELAFERGEARGGGLGSGIGDCVQVGVVNSLFYSIMQHNQSHYGTISINYYQLFRLFAYVLPNLHKLCK